MCFWLLSDIDLNRRAIQFQQKDHTKIIWKGYWTKLWIHISPVRAISITPAPIPAPASPVTPAVPHSSTLTSAPTPTPASALAPTPASASALHASATLIMAMSLLIRSLSAQDSLRFFKEQWLLLFQLEKSFTQTFSTLHELSILSLQKIFLKNIHIFLTWSKKNPGIRFRYQIFQIILDHQIPI